MVASPLSRLVRGVHLFVGVILAQYLDYYTMVCVVPIDSLIAVLFDGGKMCETKMCVYITWVVCELKFRPGCTRLSPLWSRAMQPYMCLHSHTSLSNSLFMCGCSVCPLVSDHHSTSMPTYTYTYTTVPRKCMYTYM